MVRRLDRERYLCALFAPAAAREDLLALYAFNLELARIPELVHEPILGQVRLQWWRDALEAAFAGAPPAHEVAAALARAIKARDLPRGEIERMLTAREFDLDPSPPEDMAALESYVDATAGALNRLALAVLAPEGAADEDVSAAGDAGMAWGLAGLIRAVPFHAAANRIYLPKALLAGEGLSAEDVLARRTSPGLRRVVGTVASRARDYLAAARGRSPAAGAATALLPAVLAGDYLDRIERAGFDPFDSRIGKGHLRRQLRLWRAARQGRL